MRKFIKRIPQAEWDDVHDRGDAAKAFLTSSQYTFIIDWFKNKKEYIVDSFVKNKIKAVDESFVSQTANTIFSRIFKTTKEEQQNEMSGQFNLIEEFFTLLEEYVSIMDEYDKELGRGRLEIIKEKKI